MRLRAQMPGDQTPLPRPRGWMIGAGSVLVLGVYWAVQMIVDSGHPNGYLGRNGWDEAVRGPWPYPTELVRDCVIILGLDVLFGVWFLQRRSKTRLAVRSLTFAILNFFGLVLMSPMMMHAGSPIGELFAWLFFAACFGVVFGIGAGITNKLSPEKAP